jgi:hypothetical protein
VEADESIIPVLSSNISYGLTTTLRYEKRKERRLDLDVLIKSLKTLIWNERERKGLELDLEVHKTLLCNKTWN